MGKPLIGEALLRAAVPEHRSYLDASGYLRAVSGDDGDHMQLVAIGYTMAAHDASAARAAPVSGAHAAATRTLGDEVRRICLDLRTRPSSLDTPAFPQLDRALGECSARPPAPAHAAPRRPGFASRWGLGAVAALSVSFIVLAVVAAAAASWMLVSERTEPAAEVKDSLVLSAQASRLLSLVLEERRYEKDSFINIPDSDRVADYARKWEASRQALSASITALRRQDLDEADRRLLADMERDLQSYASGYRQVLAQVRAGTIRSAQEANARVDSFKAFAHRIEDNASAMALRAMARVQSST